VYHHGDTQIPVYKEGIQEYSLEELVDTLLNPAEYAIITVL